MTTDFTFKKISGTEQVEDVASTANVLIEDNGDIKRVPASQIGSVKTINGMEADENGNVEVEISEQVQANLMQNDETAPDYVKGRTHWLEHEYGKLLEIEAMEVDNMGYTGNYYSVENYPLQLVEGLEYEVIINDISYTVPCIFTYHYGTPVPCLGNPDILSYWGYESSENNGLPFVIYVYEPDTNMNSVQICINDWNPAHIIVNGFTETVHQIDKKYLPTIYSNDLPISVVNAYIDENTKNGIVYLDRVERNEDGSIRYINYDIRDTTGLCGDKTFLVKFEFEDTSNFTGGTCSESNSSLSNRMGADKHHMVGMYKPSFDKPMYSYKVVREYVGYDPNAYGNQYAMKFYFIYYQSGIFKNLTISVHPDNTVTADIEDAHPKAAPVADAVGETPTAAEFNALLASLRTAGLLNTAE
jgi:hypothetical protein